MTIVPVIVTVITLFFLRRETELQPVPHFVPSLHGIEPGEEEGDVSVRDLCVVAVGDRVEIVLRYVERGAELTRP
jgi:hypothetical protein